MLDQYIKHGTFSNHYNRNEVNNHHIQQNKSTFKNNQKNPFVDRLGCIGIHLQELEQQSDKLQAGIQAQQSEKASQILSINEMNQSCHPMILSNINDPRYNHLSLLRIRNATSQLKQAQLDLIDYIEEQSILHQQIREHFEQELIILVSKFNTNHNYPSRSMQLKQIRLEADLQTSETERIKIKELLEQAQREITLLMTQNEGLQEHIFDMEQRMVGVELQVDRKLKERGRLAQRQAAAAARQESREIIAQLEAQISILTQKVNIKQANIPSELREKEYQIGQTKNALTKRQEALQQAFNDLQKRKLAAYERESKLLTAQQNISNNISDLRKKQAELSQWQAQLTRKSRTVKVGRQLTMQSHLQSKDISMQSGDQLGLSKQASLKSFGRNNVHDDNMHLATTSLGQLGIRRKRTLNNQQQPQPLSARGLQNHTRENYKDPYREEFKNKIVTQVSRQFKREDGNEQMRRYNPHASHYRQGKQSREASPYRVLHDLKSRGAHLYTLPRASPSHFRQASKNSRISSVSRSKINPVKQRDAQVGGLGSKLQRLREQIKKQIDSIK